MTQYILATVLGLMMAYIALLQWITNSNKLKLALYDRRFKVYLGVMDFLKDVEMNVSVNENQFYKFVVDTAPNDFLFKQDVIDFLRELGKKAVELRKTTDPDKKKKLKTWIRGQFALTPELFKPYLYLGKIEVRGKSMNKKQTIVMWICIIITVAMILFPPTSSSYNSHQEFLLYVDGSEIDFTILSLEFFCVALVTAGLIYTLRDKKSKKNNR